MSELTKYFYKGLLFGFLLEYDTKKEEWLWIWRGNGSWHHYIVESEPRCFIKRHGIK